MLAVAEAERPWLLDRANAPSASELLALRDVANIRARLGKPGQRGGLDFDDLIAATRRLLDRASAAFVLHAQPDHISGSTRQDTNSEYWAIFAASRQSSPPARRARDWARPSAVGDEAIDYGFRAWPKVFGVRERLPDYAPLAEEAGRVLPQGKSLTPPSADP